MVVISTGSATTVLSVTATGATFTFQNGVTNGTTSRVEVWVARNISAGIISVTVTLAAAATDNFTVAIAEYSGVAVLGITATTTGTTANPSIALTTQDANNWVVGGFSASAIGIAAFTALTGNLRQAPVTAAGDLTDVAGALTDNTSATPASVTNAVSQAASTWAAVALELRSGISVAGVGKGIGSVGVKLSQKVKGAGTGVGSQADVISQKTVGAGTGKGSLATSISQKTIGTGTGKGSLATSISQKTIGTGTGKGSGIASISQLVKGTGLGQSIFAVKISQSIRGTARGATSLTVKLTQAIAGSGVGAGSVATKLSQILRVFGLGIGTGTINVQGPPQVAVPQRPPDQMEITPLSQVRGAHTEVF